MFPQDIEKGRIGKTVMIMTVTSTLTKMNRILVDLYIGIVD